MERKIKMKEMPQESNNYTWGASRHCSVHLNDLCRRSLGGRSLGGRSHGHRTRRKMSHGCLRRGHGVAFRSGFDSQSEVLHALLVLTAPVADAVVFVGVALRVVGGLQSPTVMHELATRRAVKTAMDSICVGGAACEWWGVQRWGTQGRQR